MSTDIKATLWKSAEKLRAQVDAAEYKHIVLNLIFLKYISDTFETHQEKIREMVSDRNCEYFISEDEESVKLALEERDYFTQFNVFWVPPKARWKYISDSAKQTNIGSLIDEAMTAIEYENPTLSGKLDKRFGRMQLKLEVLGELIDLISTIGFGKKYNETDLLGEVYEYFLGQFASAEGKKAGQFYTPSHVVKLLVNILSPMKGRVYDPCCGSGGMFVQSEQFIKAHGGAVNDISIYGQESNPTTWRLAAMNLAIRGLAANLGKEPSDTFAQDQFPDQKFNYIMANPPFNDKQWGGEKYESDPRWIFGIPRVNNANFAWLQHIFWKLSPGGMAGVVLANGSMSGNTGSDGKIRAAMVRSDVVEVMIALPKQLFLNTQIPVCLWFMTNDKTQNGRDRLGKTLFIDAQQFGTMESRVLKIFTDKDISTIADTVQKWRIGKGYEDVAGYCKSATVDEIKRSGFTLSPSSYVGSKEQGDDGVSFDKKFSSLKLQLQEQFELSNCLQTKIEKTINKTFL